MQTQTYGKKNATGPACATCRKTCRGCDRARPDCRRCVSKGVKCGGYPTKFKFCAIASRGKWKDKQIPLPVQARRREPAHKHGGSKSSAENTHEALRDPYSEMIMDFQSKVAHRDTRDGLREIVTHSSSKEVQESYSDTIPGARLSITSNSPQEDPEGIDLSTRDLSSPSEFHADETMMNAGLEELLTLRRTELLLSHYDRMLCSHLAIDEESAGFPNPFRELILPLAYTNIGLLHAVLGLTARHMQAAHISENSETEALEHRLEALRYLSLMLWQEEVTAPGRSDEDLPLATILILLLYDIFDCGISVNGAHLTGATAIVNRMLSKPKGTEYRKSTRFLLGSIAWLDLVRGFCGAEFLRIRPGLHQSIMELVDFNFELVVGCPRELFYIVSIAMAKAKEELEGKVSKQSMLVTLSQCEAKLMAWDPNGNHYPTERADWVWLGDAFRHACLLRVIRYRDTWATAATPRIQQSVTAILNACSKVSSESSLLKRFLLPLFMAGSDSLAPYQQHYLTIRMNEIKEQTSFQNPAAIDLLDKVWSGRAAQPEDDFTNQPWMEFVSSRCNQTKPKLTTRLRPAMEV